MDPTGHGGWRSDSTGRGRGGRSREEILSGGGGERGTIRVLSESSREGSANSSWSRGGNANYGSNRGSTYSGTRGAASSGGGRNSWSGGRGRGTSSGGSRGRGRGGTGRLPNRPGRSERGGGSNRPGGSFTQRHPQVQEKKSIEVQIEDLIYHAFLPKKLPENIQDHLVDVEDTLLENFISGISGTTTGIEGVLDLESYKSLMQRWQKIQPKWRSDAEEEYFASSLKLEILNQQEGETIPIYIRKQNCVLLITKLDDTFTQLRTFRVMMDSETVMSTVGSLVVDFPQTCDIVCNKDLLTSDIDLFHLHQLAVEDFELSLPSTTKGGATFTDYRGVPDPFLVTDWVIGTYVPVDNLPIDILEKSARGRKSIKKKIRDQVNCQMSSRAIPFRRSGMWTALKVTLQLQIQQSVAERNTARLVYKLIMLRILTSICEQYTKECVNIDLDLGCQLIAKLGRRALKIKDMQFPQEIADFAMDEDNDLGKNVLLLKQKCLEYCHSVVTTTQRSLIELWRRAASFHPVIGPIVRSTDDFRQDMLHELTWLDTHIQQSRPIALNAKQTKLENLQKAESLKKCADFQRSRLAKRYNTLEAILKNQHAFNAEYSSVDRVNETIWVYDTENFLKYLPDEDRRQEGGEEKIQNLIVAYFKNAVHRYKTKNDPVGFSHMMLVILKAVQVMDQICGDKYPLLLMYHSGIEPARFEKLLLPHQKDNQQLDEMLDYFKSRNQAATLPGLIDSNFLDETSFSVSFAQQDQVMREIRERILQNTATAEVAKTKEVKQVKAECEQLERDLRSLGGACKSTNKTDDGYIHDNKTGSRNFASMTCKQCITNSMLQFRRRSVKIFERPLPPQEYLQFAVIFELKIPPEICLLRDMLALLSFEILGEALFHGKQIRRNESSKPPPVEDWRGYMKRQGPTEDYKSKGGSALSCLDLVSPKIATSGTSNVKLMNPDVIVASVENFVVDNDLDCVFYHEKPLWFPIIKTPEDRCTFQLTSTSPSDAETYKNLQWTVSSTKHTQNKVIARHHLCPHVELSPEEYLAFGSMRSDGGRLQMRNLYRAISDRALRFKKEPVLALVLQLLWQVGPENEDGVREFHSDVKDSQFSLEFLTLLEDLADTCKENYDEPLVLMMVIVITVRILEMTSGEGNCADVCYELLGKCRNVVSGWAVKIEKNLVMSFERNDTSSIDTLKARSLEATLCSLFSYNVSTEDLTMVVFQTEEDYVHWFHAIARLHQLTEEEQCHKTISPFMEVLLDTAKMIPLKLELHRHLTVDARKDIMLQSLHQFTEDRWSKVNDCIKDTAAWKIFDPKDTPHILYGGYEEHPSDPDSGSSSKAKKLHFVSLDLIQGTFLVNGFPQTSLPAVILQHPLFRLYFNDAKFRIQRYAGMCARTTDKFHGRHYDFEMVLARNQDKGKFNVEGLIIREIQGEEPGRRQRPVLELLEAVLFRKEFGHHFSENFTHWLDPIKRVVYFRRMAKKSSDYDLPPDYILSRNEKGGKWKFFDRRQGKYLLSIHSCGFTPIASALSKVESKEDVNVLMDPVSGSITAELPRYGLRFNLENTLLHSVEYSNFHVASNQNMGTLIGLQHGLLLEQGEKPDKFSKRMLIIPHAPLESCLLNLKYHHNTVVDVNHLRQPPFFAYEYDTVLRQLKGGKGVSSWLYLAALHATTSSALPDPFTGVTGTERCLEILTSGRAWPSVPYDEECLETLSVIRELAPRRSYYAHGISFLSETKPKKVTPQEDDVDFLFEEYEVSNNQKRGPSENMEITHWYNVIPAMSAFDGFPFIVDQLLEYSGRLLEIHGKSPPQKLPPRRHNNDEREAAEESLKLQIRSYRRYLPLYNQAVIIPSDFVNPKWNDCLGTGNAKKLTYTLRDQSNTSIATGFCVWELLKISQTRLVNTFEKKSREQWQINKDSLRSYLVTDTPVAPLIPSSMSSTASLDRLYLKDLLNMEFEINWLQLYAWAMNKTSGQSQAFTIVLAALAYRGAAPLEQIMHLHHISYLAGEEQFPTVPGELRAMPVAPKRRPVGSDGESEMGRGGEVEEDCIIPMDCFYVLEEIQAILEANMIPLSVLGADEGYEGLGLEQHLAHVRTDAIRIATELKDFYPCPSVSVEDPRIREIFQDSNIRMNDAMRGVNNQFSHWFRSLKFIEFVGQVEEKLNAVLTTRLEQGKIEEGIGLYGNYKFSKMSEINFRLSIEIEGKEQEQLCLPKMMRTFGILNEAQEIFESGQWEALSGPEGENDFVRQRELCTEKIDQILKEIAGNVGGDDNDIVNKIVVASGIAPRITATTLLKHLSDPGQLQADNDPFWNYVGALAVLWTKLNRLNRCIALEKKGDLGMSNLRAEMENQGHENWSPKVHPGWLLLELELDIMIRKVQVNVALRMIRMPDGKNGVLQYNMGEGKTSVIAPMLCVTLASTDALCRVTGLQSLFRSNLSILRFAIGGLLNRRVYTFPCRRDVVLGSTKADTLLRCLEECLKRRGVILTVPEFRHSFCLLALDKILKKEYQLSRQLLHIENWLKYYCRDVLDESDEILNVKNQLVYTTGTQISIDGDSLRWTVCQKILNSVRRIASRMQEEDEGAIEFDPEKQLQHPEQFTTIRLLNEDYLEEFKELVAEDLLLTEVKLEGVQGVLARQFMVEETISRENLKLLLFSLHRKPDLLNKILLISGYLRRGVLAVALGKRWRVEYGVNSKGEKRSAVPFRAKDVAKERNQFGHPDLEIVLTHLSYYYSGLKEEHFMDTFELLKNKRGGEEIYDDWLSEMVPGSVPENLRLFQRLNLANTELANKLHDTLKKHKGVVDFWLTHFVFPRESKQFPAKFVMTGWDLCHDRNRHPITAFSGTNDTKEIYPPSIRQQDLDELKGTNEMVEQALLDPENDKNHKGLRMGVTCQEILDELKVDSIKILIDAGALMVECDNEQVADLWLDSDPEVEAVVYFSGDGEEMVKSRRDGSFGEGNWKHNARLEESPYKFQLEKCAVYLDDLHTRGVDLKFPDGSRACVTVGSKMKRDKLVQASHRMRKLLSHNHFVTFYLSREAHLKVNGGDDDERITSEQVLDWVKQNTQEFIENALPYFCHNGLNYAQKLMAGDSFNFPSHLEPFHSSTMTSSVKALDALAEQCGNAEVTLLMEMYGTFAERFELVEVIPNWFKTVQKRLTAGVGVAIPQEVLYHFRWIRDTLVRKCEEIFPGKTLFSCSSELVMEEEQEKEIEMEKETEVEEEREVQKPDPPVEMSPDLHPNVKLTILNGDGLARKPGILLASEVLKNTTFWKDVRPERWGNMVYVTEDFARVIQTYGTHASTNLYLRPIEWVASLTTRNAEDGDEVVKLLVLSPFEVNEMMPHWRNERPAMRLHMFCRRRFVNQDLLINKTGLQLPETSDICKIPEESPALAPLSLASGNLYFGSTPEKEAYVRFLATLQGETAGDDGMLPLGRRMEPSPEIPTLLVKKILSCRHPVLSEVSHVIRLLEGYELADVGRNFNGNDAGQMMDVDDE